MTTISTVGYGDIKGFTDTDGAWAIEMSYLLLIMLSGIMLFSYVSRQIFAYKTLLTVQ